MCLHYLKTVTGYGYVQHVTICIPGTLNYIDREDFVGRVPQTLAAPTATTTAPSGR